MSTAPKLDLDELMARIRAEVEERKRSAAEPDPTPAQLAPAVTPKPGPRRFTARELLALPVPEFIRGSYLTFWGREPQPHEFVRCRDRLLVSHVSKLRILREFHASPDGRRVHVEGLRQEFLWDRIYWSPPAKFGRFIGRLVGDIYRLPRRIRQFVARVDLLEQRTTQNLAAIRSIQASQIADRQNVANQNRRTLEQLGAVRQAAEVRSDGLAARMDATERNLAARLNERTQAIDQEIGQIKSEADVQRTEFQSALLDHWRNILEQKLSLERLLAAGPSSSSPAGSAQGHAQSLLDAFYLSFEDRYRGTRGAIKERQRVYLPHVERSAKATGHDAVIDIGCGRGEWIELLGESGLAARGFDLNRIAVEECKERGLNAEIGDALAVLAALPENHLAAVTSFHVIEHVPFETLVKMVELSFRVLKPGGVLILETPNPANLVVAAERFYFDPTHRNPLPSELVSYLAMSRGFEPVEVLPLHPVDWPHRQNYDDAMLAYLQDKLFGPQDYGIIAWKAA